MSYELPRWTAVAAITLAVAACSDQPTELSGPMPSYSEVSSSTALSSRQWQLRARSLVAASNLSPLAAARVYAAVGMAQYQAAAQSQGPQSAGAVPASDDPSGRAQYEAVRGAVAGAATQVLAFVFPGAAQSIEQQLNAEANAGHGTVHPHFVRGVSIGREVGSAMIARLQSDGFTTPWTGTIPSGPGIWIPNGPPAGASFSVVKPYFLTSPSQFRPAPPPAFGSAAFNADLAEVLSIAQNRTPQQAALAIALNYGAFTPTAAGYWNELADRYIAQRQLDEYAATRVFALMNAAVFDALIGCFDAKYYYWTIRPVQAQPQISLVFNAPNHPSYPSGHMCVATSAGTVLTHLFPEHTAEIDDEMSQAGLSRIYAGIHYRFDISGSTSLGAAVGHWTIARDPAAH